jgi:hypothetical protein
MLKAIASPAPVFTNPTPAFSASENSTSSAPFCVSVMVPNGPIPQQALLSSVNVSGAATARGVVTRRAESPKRTERQNAFFFTYFLLPGFLLSSSAKPSLAGRRVVKLWPVYQYQRGLLN